MGRRSRLLDPAECRLRPEAGGLERHLSPAASPLSPGAESGRSGQLRAGGRRPHALGAMCWTVPTCTWPAPARPGPHAYPGMTILSASITRVRQASARCCSRKVPQAQETTCRADAGRACANSFFTTSCVQASWPCMPRDWYEAAERCSSPGHAVRTKPSC